MSSDYTAGSGSLISSLRDALCDLTARPFPPVSNPPNCSKRASVALIIRVRPNFLHWPSSTTPNTTSDPPESTTQQIHNFFSQSWLEHGDPEVLFIKRAARSGDRWTSHVALPGGKRDPDDADDKATAVRETMEEVGTDLNHEDALFVGNLPERVVTTWWGKVPLMVLCPFIFLLTRHDVPSPKLQPTEVGSTHWVSLRALLSPSLRTFERADVSERLARRYGSLVRSSLRLMLGQMQFAAVRLLPTESLYCSSAPGFLPETPNIDPATFGSVLHNFKCWWRGNHSASASTEKPLLLWGLTLGILADFLEVLSPYNTLSQWTYPTSSRRPLSLWTYPTFTALDVRWITWAMTYTLRKRKRIVEDEHNRSKSPAAVEEGLDAIALRTGMGEEQDTGKSGKPGEVGTGRLQDNQRGSPIDWNFMLDGYYDLLRKAVILTFVLRLGVGAAMCMVIGRRYVKRRQRI